MTAPLVASLALAFVVCFCLSLLGAETTRRRRRPLPHRPAPGVPPAPRRHRAEHAHTGSISATEIRRALDAATTKKGRRP